MNAIFAIIHQAIVTKHNLVNKIFMLFVWMRMANNILGPVLAVLFS